MPGPDLERDLLAVVRDAPALGDQALELAHVVDRIGHQPVVDLGLDLGRRELEHLGRVEADHVVDRVGQHQPVLGRLRPHRRRAPTASATSAAPRLSPNSLRIPHATGRVAGLALVHGPQPVHRPHHGNEPAEQVDAQFLALGQPFATLTYQLGLGFEYTEAHALGVGARARHRLSERQRRGTVETQSLRHDGSPERQHGRPVDADRVGHVCLPSFLLQDECMVSGLFRSSRGDHAMFAPIAQRKARSHSAQLALLAIFLFLVGCKGSSVSGAAGNQVNPMGGSGTQRGDGMNGGNGGGSY